MATKKTPDKTPPCPEGNRQGAPIGFVRGEKDAKIELVRPRRKPDRQPGQDDTDEQG